MNTSDTLTRNQALVLDVLTKAKEPQSAYHILDQLRGEGLRAPLQIYRALDALIEKGNVHRLESLNAFVACSHPECDSHASMIFMICDDCKNVSETSDEKLSDQLQHLAANRTFALTKSTVELRGTCQRCQQ